MIYVLGIMAITIVSIIITTGKTEVQKKIVINKDIVEKFSPTPTNPLTPTPKITKIPTQPPLVSTPEKTGNSLQYPNSLKIETRGNFSIYESTNPPDQVTNWYKEKIKSMNMNAKSFVSTNTNGNILNKLVGVSGNNEIRVEISKNKNSSLVKIKIESSFAIDSVSTL